MTVWVYTIDKPDEAAALLDLGVDGIITNDPAAINGMVQRRAEKEAR
jgi:glycerophosphoryl diester phosphodiesterase